MTLPLLTRRRDEVRPALTLAGDIALPMARVHEACGLARRSFALWVAARMRGPVLWIHAGWSPDQLHAPGMAAFADPARFLFTACKRPDDMLWATEEALRSGAVPLVVADLPGFPNLTQVRRMHLAAETGTQEGTCRPLGLLLTPEHGGAQGVETRWNMTPAHAPDMRRWRLTRLRARTAPEKSWMITQGPDGLAPVE